MLFCHIEEIHREDVDFSMEEEADSMTDAIAVTKQAVPKEAQANAEVQEVEITIRMA